MADIGKMLLGLGLPLVVIGAMLLIASRSGIPLGKLPGDIDRERTSRLSSRSGRPFSSALYFPSS
jgi:hypothetical protein